MPYNDYLRIAPFVVKLRYDMHACRMGKKSSAAASKRAGGTHRVGARQLKGWLALYRDFFPSATIDPSTLRVAARRPSFTRLIVVAEGLTLNEVYNACVRLFPCTRYYPDLDVDVLVNDRMPTKSYALWIRNNQESDAALGNLSADDLAKKKIKGITLLEYLLNAFHFFRETGSHLDVRDITMCTGSRYSDGRVPTVISVKGELRIHWCSREDRYPRLRTRAVVTPSAK